MKLLLGVLLDLALGAIGGAIVLLGSAYFEAHPRHAVEATVSSSVAASIVHPCNFNPSEFCVTVRY